MRSALATLFAVAVAGCAGPVPADSALTVPSSGMTVTDGADGGAAPATTAPACDPMHDTCPAGKICTSDGDVCVDGCSYAKPCPDPLVCVTGECMQPPPRPSSAGLIGYWPFEDAGGAATVDASGNEHDARVDGATATGGKVGRGYAFDGRACIGVPDAALSPPARTVMAWVQAAGGGVAVGKTGEYALTAPAAGGWHLVAATFDGATRRLYVDGEPASVTAASAADDGGAGLGIGCSGVGSDGATAGATERFVGVIDEVSIYDRALSAAEIGAYYEATR